MLAEKRALRFMLMLLGGLTELGSAATTRAQPSAEVVNDAVVLSVPDCLGASGAEIRKLVALELAPRMRVLDTADARTATLSGTVHCAVPHATVAVDDPAHAHPLRVELDLAAAAPEARERLVALALAELITTSQLERAAAQSRAAEAATHEETPASNDTDQPRVGSFQLWVAPSFSVAGDPVAPLLGGDLGASHGLGPLLLSLDLQAQFGQSERAASEVSMRMLSACFGIAPLLLKRSLQLSAGIGLRVGHVHLSASAQRSSLQGDQLSAFWLGPALFAALQLPVARASATALRVAIEAGYVARPVVGLDERAQERMALRGAWLTVALGVALRMP